MRLRQLIENSVTDNPNFANWFGNSKVVDDQGMPLKVFHGSAANFDSFSSDTDNRGAMGDSVGFYFAADPEFASSYGDEGSVYPVYLRLQNPVVLNTSMINAEDVGKAVGLDMSQVYGSPDRAQPYWFLKNGGAYSGREESRVGDEVVAAARNKGHDGFIFIERLGGKPSTVYMVIEPNQIKSVFNRGTYNDTNKMSEQHETE